MMNILNGGAHADNNVDLQEFMVMPVGATIFAEGLRWCAEIYHTLKKVLQDRGLAHRRRRRGRLRARTSRATRRRSQVIVEAVEKAGYALGEQIRFALDPAATEFYDAERGVYVLAGEGRELTSAEMVEFWAGLVDRYPDHLDRGRHGRGGLGRLEAADRAPRRPRPARRRRPVRHQHRASCDAASRWAWRTRS